MFDAFWRLWISAAFYGPRVPEDDCAEFVVTCAPEGLLRVGGQAGRHAGDGGALPVESVDGHRAVSWQARWERPF